MVQQWYEVLRPDGKKQYATKYEHGYLLYGSGFAITKLDAISVTPVKEVPRVLVEGKAYIEDGPKWRALINENQWWNGWAMPYIHAKHVKAVLKDASGDPETDEYACTFTFKDGIITVVDRGAPETYTIEPEVINGEIWYWFGDLGWIWSFDQKK